jgi:hypothetical protein
MPEPSLGDASAGKYVASGVYGLIFGNFNPDYSKENQKRMRYIQQKYAQAYSDSGGEDPNLVIAEQDQASKLKMSADGKRPANPFPDERSFDDSLKRQTNRVAGHEGRFAASHALTSIGTVIEYQVQRRSRTWIPNVQQHGRPNDYINLFLEELKVWLKNHLTRDEVSLEEMRRRSTYLTKLKNDNYHWCFPTEKGKEYSLHRTIDFTHERIDDCRAILEREEKNKSMQRLFKELNDHATNTLEFGKNFLAFLLYSNKKAGADLPSKVRYEGKTIGTGKLLRLLEETASMRSVHRGSGSDDDNQKSLMSGDPSGPADGVACMAVAGTGRYQVSVRPPPSRKRPNSVEDDVGSSGGVFRAKLFEVAVMDPRGNRLQVIGKSFVEFETLVKKIEVAERDAAALSGFNWKAEKVAAAEEEEEVVVEEEDMKGQEGKQEEEEEQEQEQEQEEQQEEEAEVQPDEAWQRQQLCQLLSRLPSKARLRVSDKQLVERSVALRSLLSVALSCLPVASEATAGLLACFFGAVSLALPATAMLPAEEEPNVFMRMRQQFLHGSSSEGCPPAPSGSSGAKDGRNAVVHFQQPKELAEFEGVWGTAATALVFEAHALLQRLATLLAWTYEINTLFLAMFGNTLAFSQLPLRDLVRGRQHILDIDWRILTPALPVSAACDEAGYHEPIPARMR